MSSEIRIQHFFRCEHCRMPHELGTARCPVTDKPIAASAAIPLPAPAEESDATTFLARTRKPTRFVEGWMLDGRYRLGARIASGAMGVVYRAQHVRLERPVAIKVIGREHAVGGAEEDRLFREGKLGARIVHPSVCAVLDLGVLDDGAPYLVMELLEGETAKARLARMQRLHASEALRIARAIAGALEAVHGHGIVHRDVKPSNVLIARERDFESAKLIDLGLAAEIDGRAARAERGKVIVGTPAYLAPEVLMGHPASAKSDLYSLGASLYELLTGRAPIPAEPGGDHREHVKRVLKLPVRAPSAIRGDVPSEADGIALALLAKEPEKRPTPAALIAAIDEALLSIEHVEDDSEPTLASGGHRF